MEPNPIVEAYKFAVSGCQTYEGHIELMTEILDVAEQLVEIVKVDSLKRIIEILGTPK